MARRKADTLRRARAAKVPPNVGLVRFDYVRKHNLGRGLIANRDIPAGTRIYAEAPFFAETLTSLSDTQTPTSNRETTLEWKIRQLPDDTQSLFLNKFNNKPFMSDLSIDQHVCTPYLGRFISHAIPLDLAPFPTSQRSGEVGVFSKMSYLNHACIPNAQVTWNSALQKVTLHAIKGIPAEEEITISYVPEARVRPQWLHDNYGFNCCCVWCMRADRESKDELQARHQAIAEISDALTYIKDHLKVFELGYNLLVLFQHEQISDWRQGLLFSDMFETLADLAQEDEDGKERETIHILERARIFAGLAFLSWEISDGGDSHSIANLVEKCARLVAISGGKLEPILLNEYVDKYMEELRAKVQEGVPVSFLLVDDDDAHGSNERRSPLHDLRWLFCIDMWSGEPMDVDSREAEEGVKGKGKGKAMVQI